MFDRRLFVPGIIALAGLLTGCGSVPKQAFNAEASPHVKHLAVTQYEEQKDIGAVVVNHAGNSFGLIGMMVAAVDQNSKTAKLTAALDLEKTRPTTLFHNKLNAALTAQGYELMPVALRRDDIEPEIKNKLTAIQGVDANLLVRADASYMAAGATSDYLPAVNARAEVFDRKEGKLLYRELYAYGFNGAAAKDTVTLPAAPECKFTNLDAVVSQAPLARKCLVDGLEAVAQAIADDLKR